MSARDPEALRSSPQRRELDADALRGRAISTVWMVVVPLVLGGIVGRAEPKLGVAVAGALLLPGLYLVLWLPRRAHAAFVAGRFSRAARRYRRLGRLRRVATVRALCEISVAACDLQRGRLREGLTRLDRLSPDALAPAARAAWLNNRAYACGRLGEDLSRAGDDVDEALRLRPDVGAFHHTRGLVCLSGGDADEAVRELDLAWSRGEEHQRGGALEAERCRDLAHAWRTIGESAYADEYLARSRTCGPGPSTVP